jgi:hypothetical protein
MTQADSVYSTPPTSTSAKQSRRSILGAIAAGSIAALASTIAEPATTAAALAADPIYAVIERHKAAGAIWEAAVDVRADFPDLHMNDEQVEQCELLDETEDAAWESCEQAGIDLVTTKPTTHAGMVAAIRYIRIQMRDDGTFMPHGLEYENGGDAQETMGWIDAFLDTLADAATELDLVGKAVRS